MKSTARAGRRLDKRRASRGETEPAAAHGVSWIDRSLMPIRTATVLDADEVRGVHEAAFPEGERELVANLAVNLLLAATTPPTLSLVAEAEGVVVGHAAFSPVAMCGLQGLPGYLLAPLAVRPNHQGRHLGSQLVKSGIQRLARVGVGILFVYGDPKFYGRLGFSGAAAARHTPPYRLRYPFGWQAIVLQEGGMESAPAQISCVAALCDPELW